MNEIIFDTGYFDYRITLTRVEGGKYVVQYGQQKRIFHSLTAAMGELLMCTEHAEKLRNVSQGWIDE